MDKIATLQNCIGVLCGINVRVDQSQSVAKPCIDVINALATVVQEMQKDAEDDNKDEQQ